MLKNILDTKSGVEINEGKWQIRTEYSDDNHIGAKGKDDLICRQDAVKLVALMNIKLAESYEKAKREGCQVSEDLLETTKVLDYVLWGLRELPPAELEFSGVKVVKFDEISEGGLWTPPLLRGEE